MLSASERTDRTSRWLYGLLGGGVGFLIVGLLMSVFDSEASSLGIGLALVGAIELMIGLGMLVAWRNKQRAG